MNFKLYQLHWELIKVELYNAVNFFMTGGDMRQNIIHTFITLILKKLGVLELGQFRLIYFIK